MTLRNEEPHVNKCFPRMRGDVPDSPGHQPTGPLFSPHARGCSSKKRSIWRTWTVFPACAGMFRSRPPHHPKGSGFPRMRGDVPTATHQQASTRAFSPHARGCSQWRRSSKTFSSVFPACAGMFRPTAILDSYGRGFPRMRGDVPRLVKACFCKPLFSPHARGCSGSRLEPPSPRNVFPACAGMFLG